MSERPIELLADHLARAAAALQAEGLVPPGALPAHTLEPPKQREHGDLASNLALVLAKPARRAPRQLAQELIARLGDCGGLVERAEIAGPGFINFFVSARPLRAVLGQILGGPTFLRVADPPRRVLVEFVSANPTGPLHVGHGRGAVTGDALVRLLRRAGHEVVAEYYVNDAGQQVEVLAASVLIRYQELCGQAPPHPEEFYPGDYVIDLAREVHARHGQALLERPAEEVLALLRESAIATVLGWIKADLGAFGIRFDVWQSERELYTRIDIPALLERLRAAGHLYEQDGKQWFRTTAFGDEKDRVVLREDGRPTYFASDLAYHDDKLRRGFDRLINVWGADHVGYIARVKAGLAACGHDPDRLRVVLVQMVNLLRDGQPVKMGKRAGQFVLLSELYGETGADPARFFFVLRSSDAQLDFDIALATRRSLDNPVYYVQYGHARLCSILRQAQARGIAVPSYSDAAVAALTLPEELELCKLMARAPDVLRDACEALEPHRVVFYLREAVAAFHSYYTRYKGSQRVLSDDPATTGARLLLCAALRALLADLLGALGIEAPERMELADGAADEEPVQP